jgi:uncharacterized protein
MWKQRLAAFIGQHNHPSWGITHCERVYELAVKLAQQQDIEVDKDVLLAAAYLHDISELEPYKQAGIDSVKRSASFADEMMASANFPEEKRTHVKRIILEHTSYADKPTSVESTVFRDADILDFLGAIGVARMLAIVGIDDQTPNIKAAISLIQRFSKELPNRLITRPAKKIGKVRQAEMRSFLAALSGETSKFEDL